MSNLKNKSNSELLESWLSLDKQLDAIDYDNIITDMYEFGNDDQIASDFIDFQVNEISEYEDELENAIWDIEQELKSRGFEIVNELEKVGKGYNWLYKLKRI
jgi:hypothetical protein